MKTHIPLRLLPVACLIVQFAFTAELSAQEKSAEVAATEKPKPAVAKVEGAAESSEAAKPKAHVLPKGIEDVVQLSEAGVSTAIISKFMENSGVAYEPTGAAIIAMKQRGVPDEVTVAMLTRSASIRAEYEAARKRIAAPAIVRTLATDGQLDPESYEFFWYHHAYPRALAGSYKALAPPSQSQLIRSSKRTGPRWRTDGFTSDSFAPGGNAKRPAKN